MKIKISQEFQQYLKENNLKISSPAQLSAIFFELCYVPEHREPGALSLVKECLDLGVKINDFSDNNPAIMPALTWRPDIAVYLLKNGAYDAELKKWCGQNKNKNLMIRSVGFEMEEHNNSDKIWILNFLYETKDFDLKTLVNKDGLNLLQACYFPEVAQWLLERGADPLIKNKHGQNAIQYHQKKVKESITSYSRHTNHSKMVDCLKPWVESLTILNDFHKKKKTLSKTGNLKNKKLSSAPSKRIL